MIKVCFSAQTVSNLQQINLDDAPQTPSAHCPSFQPSREIGELSWPVSFSSHHLTAGSEAYARYGFEMSMTNTYSQL
ncbi:hypothetical protein CEXT_173261 [Caerostris extrusa]|uniref:Uncharacterized protein n=1 Tax=Caerostris extrusa TaxID=172846 RepID=A0AAV4VWS0_CAEEX|nr:hypothetical protein CEXT_173261 [Caerostris extrusa]